jgi:TolA-binding protein
LGRAWLDEGKPATAVKIFYDNYKNDPKGDRAPESLYFLGEALTDLNKAAEACEAFGQLAGAYPAEASGRLAAACGRAQEGQGNKPIAKGPKPGLRPVDGGIIQTSYYVRP